MCWNLVGEEESFHIGILTLDAHHHGLVAEAVHHSFVYHSIGVRIFRLTFRHVCQDVVTEVEFLGEEVLKFFQCWVCTHVHRISFHSYLVFIMRCKYNI